MRPWFARPSEIANLFNPAFCCAVLAGTVTTYTAQAGLRLPFALAFVALPIVLHKKTRDALPYNVRTSLPAWLEQHPVVKVEFFERAVAIKPIVRDAILFGLQHRALFLEHGRVGSYVTDKNLQSLVQLAERDTRECLMAARRVGKWFAAAGNPETVLGLWEIRP